MSYIFYNPFNLQTATIISFNTLLIQGITFETYEITFSYADAKTKVIEVVKEIQNKKLPKTPEKSEEVKTGDTTMILLPIGIAVLTVAGIGIVLWRIRRTKR